MRRGERLVRGIDGWESDASLQALMSAQELPSVDGWPHISAADVPGLVVLARGQVLVNDQLDQKKGSIKKANHRANGV